MACRAAPPNPPVTVSINNNNNNNNINNVREFHQGGYPAWILTVYTGAKVAFQTIVVNGNA